MLLMAVANNVLRRPCNRRKRTVAPKAARTQMGPAAIKEKPPGRARRRGRLESEAFSRDLDIQKALNLDCKDFFNVKPRFASACRRARQRIRELPRISWTLSLSRSICSTSLTTGAFLERATSCKLRQNSFLSDTLVDYFDFYVLFISSALGQKQTCAAAKGDVRFTPESGHVRCN